MSSVQTRKNKVNISEYNYQREVQNRLFLSHATVMETDIINEIINNSLRFTVNQLLEVVNISKQQLMDILKKLTQVRLIKVQNDVVIVDKETRKYFEGYLEKFQEDFIPGIEFLHYLLDQVPISTLPSWYVIPRTTDNIFQAIVEKFLATPKIYERYLEELQLDNPTLAMIYKDVFAAPDYVLTAKEIMQQHHLSHEQFEEYMLLLEYNFVCRLGYRKRNDCWEEVVSPFYEWHEYLRYRRDTMPQSLYDPKAVQRCHPKDFGFIEDVSTLLKSAYKSPISLQNPQGAWRFNLDELSERLKQPINAAYARRLLEVGLEIELAQIKNSQWVVTPLAKLWLNKSEADKAEKFCYHLSTVEKSLSRLRKNEWVYLQDFMRGFVSSNGAKEQVVLKHKGKKWKYEFPLYTPEELLVFEDILYQRLFEGGILAAGVHQGKKCIMLTSFGHMMLSY